MRILALPILLALILTACGTKGPLYIPEKRYPQKTPAEVAAPDTAPTEKPQETQ